MARTSGIRPRRLGRPRRGPARSKAYLAFIREQPCLICGVKVDVEAAHTGPHGMSQKASDFDAIPLCGFAHHREGATSHHKLGVNFAAYWKLDLPAAIAELRGRFLKCRAA